MRKVHNMLNLRNLSKSRSPSGRLSILSVAQGKDVNFGLDQFQKKADELTGLDGAQFYITIAQNIIGFLLALSAALAVLYGIYTAVIILGAFGDEAKIAAAKKNLVSIAIGLAVIALVYGILELIPRFLTTGKL